MAHVIHKGKYLYEHYRKDGKVKSEYLGVISSSYESAGVVLNSIEIGQQIYAILQKNDDAILKLAIGQVKDEVASEAAKNIVKIIDDLGIIKKIANECNVKEEDCKQILEYTIKLGLKQGIDQYDLATVKSLGDSN